MPSIITTCLFGCAAVFAGILLLSYMLPSDRKGGSSETYLGAFPLIVGVLAAVAVSAVPCADRIWQILAFAASLGIAGLLSDLRLLGSGRTFLVMIIIFLIAFKSGLGVNCRQSCTACMQSVIWPLFVIALLKLATGFSREFFLLTCIGGGVLVLVIPVDTLKVTLPNALFVSFIVCAPLTVLIFRISRRLCSMGDSGVFAIGWLMSAVIADAGETAVMMCSIYLITSAMVYPVVFYAVMIAVSFFRNGLHRQSEREKVSRRYFWKLSRTMLVLFTTCIYTLSIISLILVLNKAPWHAYVPVVIFLAVAEIIFLKKFAVRVPESAMEQAEYADIFGIRIFALGKSEVLERIRLFVTGQPRFSHVVTADSLALVRAQRSKNFRAVINRADLIIPDGAGLIWAADFLGTPVSGRIPGVGLAVEICGLARDASWPVFFVGGRPGIAEKAAEKLSARFPGLRIAGTHHGFFSADTEGERKVIAYIANAAPKIIFVAMGVPRQEYFIDRLRQNLESGLAIGIGGSLDVLSGSIPRAPVRMQNFGLEWLYRLMLEPRRFRRMMGLPRFIAGVFRCKLDC